MLISIAIPCYRSAKTLPGVVAEITEVFSKQTKYDYEIILVNDGSPDNTFEVIHRLCGENPKITGVNLSKNFGQSAAKMAAVEFVSGEYLVYMDDDGQHPAEGIFTLVEKINEGYDMVYANFASKKHSLFKRMTSDLHNWYLSKIGSKPKDIHLSSFYAFSKFCIDAMKTGDCPVIAAGTYLRQLSTRIVNVDMPHRARKEGKSGYSLKKLFRLWHQSITSFNTKLLGYSMTLGIAFGTLGFIYALFIIIRKIVDPSVAMGYSSLMAALLILSGVIMFLISIMSDYIGKIYLIICKLPPFKVRDVIKNDGKSVPHPDADNTPDQ